MVNGFLYGAFSWDMQRRLLEKEALTGSQATQGDGRKRRVCRNKVDLRLTSVRVAVSTALGSLTYARTWKFSLTRNFSGGDLPLLISEYMSFSMYVQSMALTLFRSITSATDVACG